MRVERVGEVRAQVGEGLHTLAPEKLPDPVLEVVTLVDTFLEQKARDLTDDRHAVDEAFVLELAVVEDFQDVAQLGVPVTCAPERCHGGAAGGARHHPPPPAGGLHLLERAYQADALDSTPLEDCIGHRHVAFPLCPAMLCPQLERFRGLTHTPEVRRPTRFSYGSPRLPPPRPMAASPPPN